MNESGWCGWSNDWTLDQLTIDQSFNPMDNHPIYNWCARWLNDWSNGWSNVGCGWCAWSNGKPDF